MYESANLPTCADSDTVQTENAHSYELTILYSLRNTLSIREDTTDLDWIFACSRHSMRAAKL
jgi:hypothetical protein